MVHGEGPAVFAGNSCSDYIIRRRMPPGGRAGAGAVLTEYGRQGYGLVIAAGSQFDDAVATVAPGFLDTTRSGTLVL